MEQPNLPLNSLRILAAHDSAVASGIGISSIHLVYKSVRRSMYLFPYAFPGDELNRSEAMQFIAAETGMLEYRALFLVLVFLVFSTNSTTIDVHLTLSFTLYQ